MDQQGGLVPAKSLLSNPLIAQALKQRGGSPGAGGQPGNGQPPQQGQPQGQPQPPQPAQQPPPDPMSEEAKICLDALAGHLKHIDKVTEAKMIPPKPPAQPSPMQVPQQAQTQLLGGMRQGGI